MKQTGVGGVLSVAHTAIDGTMHGHTYEIIAWYRHGHDALALRSHLEAVLAKLDHKVLPDTIRWAEELAEHIGRQLPGCIEVQANRNPERIFASWIREE